MLELPEVEVLRKDLEKEVVGKRVKEVEVATPSIVKPFHRTRPEFVKALEERKILGVRRRGVVLFVDLDDDVTWIINAGATTSVHRQTANEPAGADTHLVVRFTTGGALHLTDASKDVEISTGVVPTEEAFAAVGVVLTAFDPIADNMTWMDFGQLLKEANGPLKLVLIDRSVIDGIGPVYSDEILYEAGLRYDRSSGSLSTQEIRRLQRATHEVITAAMKARGSSLDDEGPDEAVDDEGEAAGHLKVYGRAGLPSPRSRRPIEKVRVKRGVYTYFDPQSQY